MLKLSVSVLSAIVLCVFMLVPRAAHADETVGGQVKDAAGDASIGMKKAGRSAKRGVRKATGNDTMGKDMKDKANDMKDDATNEVDKAKRK